MCSTCKKRGNSQRSRDARLRDTYGISLDEYQQILQAQDGRCAICHRAPRYNLDVDHDHGNPTPRANVRGLLCKPCNRRLLPSAKDSKEVLYRAADYLHDPPAQRVLRVGLDAG